VHKGKLYTGEHEPIVDQELWDEVQARLAVKARRGRTPPTFDRTRCSQDC
jgi:hypothetical protein